MKKILFTGTTSSGKSTMWRFLKETLSPSIMFIEEIARELLLKYPGIEKDPSFQTLLFAEQVKREKEAAAQKPNLIICDRGSIDIVAHAQLFGQSIQPEWIDWSQTYDSVCYFDKNDISFETTPLQKHISHERNWLDFREQLDDQLRQSIQTCCLPYHIIAGTHQERVHQLMTLLEPSLKGNKRP